MIEARSYTRENYLPPPSPQTTNYFTNGTGAFLYPQKLQDLHWCSQWFWEQQRCSYSPEKLGFASSQFVNHFTSGSGAFLYPQNYWKSCDEPAAGEIFGDSLVFLEQILKFFITHRSAYKKYEILKLLKTSKNSVLGPPQAKIFWVPDRVF